jgi:transcription initiation factor TFIIIB Brf1 subunit/transcription initiation factor TFIIB
MTDTDTPHFGDRPSDPDVCSECGSETLVEEHPYELSCADCGHVLVVIQCELPAWSRYDKDFDQSETRAALIGTPFSSDDK